MFLPGCPPSPPTWPLSLPASMHWSEITHTHSRQVTTLCFLYCPSLPTGDSSEVKGTFRCLSTYIPSPREAPWQQGVPRGVSVG